MTSRKLHIAQAGDDCGCHDTVSNGCEVVTYGKCISTYTPISRKSTKRYCMDFAEADCDACCDGFYQRIRQIEVEKTYSPDCLQPSEGYIRISNEKMNAETGMFCFSVDANDTRMNLGERFLITVWASTPNANECKIQAYISVCP